MKACSKGGNQSCHGCSHQFLTGSGAPPTAARLAGSPLARLTGLEEGDVEIPAPTQMVLRCTLGELAARGGSECLARFSFFRAAELSARHR